MAPRDAPAPAAGTIGAQPLGRRATLLCVATLTVMSGATVAPSLPAIEAHFADTSGAAMLTRLVLTVTALFIAISAPMAGWIIDRFGRKRLLMVAIVAYGLAGASGLLLDTLHGILAGRAVLGMAVAAIMTTATTLVGDYFVGPARNRFMGIQSGFMALGGVVFLIAGGGLADLHWRAPFAIYLTALVLLPAVALTIGEPHRPARGLARDGGPADDGLPMALIVVLYGVSVINMVVFYAVPVQLPFFMQELGVLAPSSTGLAIAAMALAAAIASSQYGRIRERLSHPMIFGLAYLTVALAYAVIATAESYVQVLVGLVLGGFGLGANMPNATVWLLGTTPERVRGRVIGGLSTCIFLGQFLSPLASQPIAIAFGLPVMYGCAATLALVVGSGFTVAALVQRRRRVG